MTVAFLLVLQKSSKQLQVPEINATQQTNLFIFALLVSSSYCHLLGSQKISSFYHDNPCRKEDTKQQTKVKKCSCGEIF